MAGSNDALAIAARAQVAATLAAAVLGREKSDPAVSRAVQVYREVLAELEKQFKK